MKLIKTKKRKGNIVLRFSLICMYLFFAAMIVKQQLEIGVMEVELDTYADYIQVQEEYNTVLQYSLITGSLSGSDYVDEYARTELDYISSGERVFVIIGGDIE